MATHMKIYFPNGRFEGIRVSCDQTIRDIVFDILIKLEIPIKYYQACVIVRAEPDGQSILSYDTRVEDITNVQMARFEFKIIVMPIFAEFDRLEFELLNLMYHQVNMWIVMNYYPIQQVENYFTLAGYQCAHNFGPYQADKHKKNYLKSVLRNILPRQALKSYSEDSCEQRIFNVWQYIDPVLAHDQNMLVLNYLVRARQLIPQFGSYVFVGKYNGKTNALYSINQQGVQIREQGSGKCIFDGKIGTFNQEFGTQNELCITSLKTGQKRIEHKFKCKSSVCLENYIDYILSCNAFERDVVDEYVNNKLAELRSEPESTNVGQGKEGDENASPEITMELFKANYQETLDNGSVPPEEQSSSQTVNDELQEEVEPEVIEQKQDSVEPQIDSAPPEEVKEQLPVGAGLPVHTGPPKIARPHQNMIPPKITVLPQGGQK